MKKAEIMIWARDAYGKGKRFGYNLHFPSELSELETMIDEYFVVIKRD